MLFSSSTINCNTDSEQTWSPNNIAECKVNFCWFQNLAWDPSQKSGGCSCSTLMLQMMLLSAGESWNDLYFVDTYLWPSPGPLHCWKTSWCSAPWTKPCKNSTQHAVESRSPSLACSQWGGGRKRLKMLLPSCWKTRCRKGGSPLRHRNSIRSVTPRMRQEGRVQKSLWCLTLELEVREWWMIWKDRKRSSLGTIVSSKVARTLKL